MSEQWMGLHNPDQHEPGWGERDAWCSYCEGPKRDRGTCTADVLCRCCLAAEVESLRAQVAAVRAVLARPRDFRGNGSEWNECRAAVLRALDGDA